MSVEIEPIRGVLGILRKYGLYMVYAPNEELGTSGPFRDVSDEEVQLVLEDFQRDCILKQKEKKKAKKEN